MAWAFHRFRLSKSLALRPWRKPTRATTLTARLHAFEVSGTRDDFRRSDLSADTYISISKTSRATTTGDLQDLVERGVLTRTGERRHTRYYLKLCHLAGR
jgi:hypothetical protein